MLPSSVILGFAFCTTAIVVISCWYLDQHDNDQKQVDETDRYVRLAIICFLVQVVGLIWLNSYFTEGSDILSAPVSYDISSHFFDKQLEPEIQR